MSSEASERDLDALADAVAERLEPGSYGDKMLLNRRQLLALAGAGVSAGALGTLGVTEAEAQEVVGQVGTDQERVDVYGGEGDFQSLRTDYGDITAGDVGVDQLGPFQDADLTPIIQNDAHLGLTSVIFPVSETDWVIVYREGDTHTIDTSSFIRAVTTDDQARSFEGASEQTILDDATDARNFGGMVMGGGRLGLFVPRHDGSDYISPKFVYSDDGGSTWSETTLSGVTDSAQGYEMKPYPASVGGDDTNGYIVPGDDAGLNEMRVWYTTDNGASWSDSLVDTTSTYLEPTIGRVGTQDKWVAVARDNTSADQPGGVYTTTDLLNWSGPTQMNISLGKNRPKLVEYESNLNLLTTNRQDVGAISGYPEAVLSMGVDAEAVFDNPGSAWQPWSVLARGSEKLVGYPDVVEVSGQYHATLCDYDEGSTAQLSLLSSVKGADGWTVDWGYIPETTAPVSSDGTWDTSDGSTEVTINFNKEFSHRPWVMVFTNSGIYKGFWTVQAVGYGGFTAYLVNMSSQSSITEDAKWVAIGY